MLDQFVAHFPEYGPLLGWAKARVKEQEPGGGTAPGDILQRAQRASKAMEQAAEARRKGGGEGGRLPGGEGK